jgi:hypothetical protein
MAQQRPDMRRMMLDPGQLLDHQRDALQGPQLPAKPVGGGAVSRACSTVAS